MVDEVDMAVDAAVDEVDEAADEAADGEGAPTVMTSECSTSRSCLTSSSACSSAGGLCFT